MSSTHANNMARSCLRDAQAALEAVDKHLDLVDEHVSDVRVGRYTIHRSKDQVFVQKGNGTWVILDEALLATAIGSAYEKNMAERVGS